MGNFLTSFFGNVAKAVVKVVHQITQPPRPPPPPLPPPAPPAPHNFFTPLIFPAQTSVGASLFSTQQTYSQQYAMQTYNSDGNPVTKIVSLSEINNASSATPLRFDPRASINAVSPTDKQAQAVLLQGAALNPSQIQKALEDSLKVDYFMCLKSLDSSTVEFNTLQTPKMEASLQYNFYTPDETVIDTQENPENDPFVNNQEVPRYVQLEWDPVDTLQQSADFAPRTKEELDLINQYMRTVRGVATDSNSSIANSFQSNLGQVNSLKRNGVDFELIDTHGLETAFNSIANGKMFKNSALTTLNTNTVDLNKIDFNDLLLDDL